MVINDIGLGYSNSVQLGAHSVSQAVSQDGLEENGSTLIKQILKSVSEAPNTKEQYTFINMYMGQQKHNYQACNLGLLVKVQAISHSNHHAKQSSRSHRNYPQQPEICSV